jgi:V8-like Glu-specific endopeptidase
MRVAPPNRRSVVVLAVLAASAIAFVPATLAHAGQTSPGVSRVNPATPVTTPHGLVPVYDPKQKKSLLLTPKAAAPIINAYWTPARMASAIPSDVPAGKADRAGTATTKPVPDGRPFVVSRPVPPLSTGVHAASVSFTNTVGKVFFRFPSDAPNLTRSCSASAVSSPKRRLVLTAGHCVFLNGQWAQNWVFKAGYEFGEGPAGAFPALTFWVWSGWTNSADSHYDYAFVPTANNQFGQRVVDRVGGNGVIANAGRPFVTALGYPSNFAGGEQQWFCQGGTSRRNPFDSDTELDGCPMGQGSSGGPMLENYNNGTGIGSAVSVVAYNLPGVTAVFGAYFDGDTTTLFNFAENSSP